MKKIILGLLLVATCLMMGCAANIKEGITYLEEEKYEEAIKCFEKDIKEKKNLGEAYRGMAIAQYEMGQYNDAIDSFENALKNETEETATIYSLMAASCLQIGEYENALDYYARALKIEDCTEEMKQEILYNEIAAYQELGDWDTLKEKVASYVESYPDDDRMDKTAEFLETR
ncbi:MAG: tetratricopeptide repeat protein [Tyzzerella sp.]|nr:tetratricopeptide repeat protein [Tyzzerella sp.]